MRLSRVIIAILLTGSSLSVLSQNQKGYVKTLGRPNQKGQALSGVSVRAKGAHNAVLSKNDGTFTLVMTGKKNGDSYALQQVQKTGYELNDVGVISRSYALSSKVPITIVMVSQQQLQEDKLRIENKAYEKAEKNYKEKITILEQQKKDNLLTEENYRQQLQELQNSFKKYESLIGSLADHYAHTDYDELDEKEREINLCIEKGELEHADSLLHTLFDPTNVLIHNKEDIINIEKRLLEAKIIKEKAKRDMAMILKQQEKDAEYLYQLYTIALARFDNDKARFYIDTRAELDTTNVSWQLEAGQFYSEFLADYSKAMSLMERGLRNARVQYGEQSEQVANSYLKIGSVYEEIKKTKEALEYMLNALNIRQVLYDKLHPLLADCYSGLGAVYGMQADYAKAFECTKQALLIRENFSNKPNEDVAESYFAYGFLYASTGKYAEGLDNLQKSLDMIIDIRGENYIHVADTYHNMGAIYLMTGNYEKAKEYVTKGLDIRKRLLSETHPDVAESWNMLGNLHVKKGDYKEALSYFEKTLSIRIQLFGEVCSPVAISYNNIGAVWKLLNDIDKAIEYTSHSIDIRKTIHGSNNPELGVSYLNIAGLYEKKGDHNKAIETITEALDISKKYYGESHPHVAMCYNSMGSFYSNTEQTDKALVYYKKALEIDKNVLGEKHPDTGLIYNNIGFEYLKKGKEKEAINYLNFAITSYIESVGLNHPQTKVVIQNLDTSYKGYLAKYPKDENVTHQYKDFKETYLK